MKIAKVQLKKNNFEVLNSPKREIFIESGMEVLSNKSQIKLGEGLAKIIFKGSGYTESQESGKIGILKFELELEVNYLVLSEEKKEYNVDEFSKEMATKMIQDILEPINYNLLKAGFNELQDNILA